MERIEIYVHNIENKDTTLVEVNINDTIWEFEKRLNLLYPAVIFYNSMILANTLTFKFYGITNGDHLYISTSRFLQNFRFEDPLKKLMTTIKDKLKMLRSCEEFI